MSGDLPLYWFIHREPYFMAYKIIPKHTWVTLPSPTLPETNSSSPLKIGLNAPKGNDPMRNIHFQVQTGCFQKIEEKHPKWMIYNGQPHFLMDDLEENPTIFNHPCSNARDANAQNCQRPPQRADPLEKKRVRWLDVSLTAPHLGGSSQNEMVNNH